MYYDWRTHRAVPPLAHCDHDHLTVETRQLPLDTEGSAAIVCIAHYFQEVSHRLEGFYEYGWPEDWTIPEWDELEVVEGGR